MEKTQLKDIDNNPLYPTIDIADDLTTDDPTTALSAKQGKVLDTKVTELSSNVGNKADKSYVDSNITASAQAAQSSAQSASQAQESANQAQQSAHNAEARYDGILNAMQSLPDGSAVSAQVAINTADIERMSINLDGKKAIHKPYLRKGRLG